MMILLPLALLGLGRSAVAAEAPWPMHPTWEPTYNMSMSTVMMPCVPCFSSTCAPPFMSHVRWPLDPDRACVLPVHRCNTTGWFDPRLAASYGIADFDWSNVRESEWARSKPMDDGERLIQQAAMVKQINPKTHVWVYRNLVKALSWYKDVGEKLADPAYSGWFLHFAPGGAKDLGSNKTWHSPQCTAGVCSTLFVILLHFLEHLNCMVNLPLVSLATLSRKCNQMTGRGMACCGSRPRKITRPQREGF
jgi:hypothetical protein